MWNIHFQYTTGLQKIIIKRAKHMKKHFFLLLFVFVFTKIIYAQEKTAVSDSSSAPEVTRFATVESGIWKNGNGVMSGFYAVGVGADIAWYKSRTSDFAFLTEIRIGVGFLNNEGSECYDWAARFQVRKGFSLVTGWGRRVNQDFVMLGIRSEIDKYSIQLGYADNILHLPGYNDRRQLVTVSVGIRY